jgi:hypothetical protein
MRYSHAYKKLEKDEYTTIRRRKFGNIGDITPEIVQGKYSHDALITDLYRSKLTDLSDQFLMEDTGAPSRFLSYVVIQSFYRTILDMSEELFYIYHLKKVKENED